MKKFLFTFLLLFLVTTLFAAKAPSHRSLRAESMGGAHVAVVDDKEAIYFNYAGLNQINRLGNFELRPEQGYYPRNFIGDMRLNLGSSGPFETVLDVYEFANDMQKLYKSVNKAARDSKKDELDVLIDTLANHPELVKRINSYDHKNLTLNVKFDAEMAFHNFGGAMWINGNISPYFDNGIILPFIAVDTFYVDGVMQAGFAFGITDNLSIGIGGKIAERQKINILRFDILNYEDLTDTLETRYDEVRENFFNFDNISAGVDLGVLYQLTREFRLGVSLRDVYLKELAGDKFTPNLTMGFNYSPRFFNKNTGYARKFNIACDYADAFYSERNYKPLSHINFGFEIEQNLLAWPGYYNEIRILMLRLAAGFRGGYPSAGAGLEILRFATIEFATWAEELGFYTGQDEIRFYMGQISIGF